MTVKVLYNSVDVSADFSPLMVGFEYVDAASDKTDTVNLTLVNDSRFMGSWYPDAGDTLNVEFGYEGSLVPAGIFQIDKINFTGPPDQVKLCASAAPFSASLRTKKSRAFEKVTLRQIADKVAAENGMVAEGDVDQTVVIPRITQHRETDLSFLSRIFKEYGYGFSSRAAVFYFYAFTDLELANPILGLSRSDLISYDFSDKTNRIYRSAELSHRDPAQNALIEETNDQGADTDDTLRLFTPAKTTAEARMKTNTALYLANSKKVSGSVSLPGDPRLTAGLNIELSEFGQLNGTYHILSSRHIISRSGGYRTVLELKKTA